MSHRIVPLWRTPGDEGLCRLQGIVLGWNGRTYAEVRFDRTHILGYHEIDVTLQNKVKIRLAFGSYESRHDTFSFVHRYKKSSESWSVDHFIWNMKEVIRLQTRY